MKLLTGNHYIFTFLLMLLSAVGSSQKRDSLIFDYSSLQIREIATNSVHSDFGPVVVGDSLYFTSFNDELSGKNELNSKNKKFYDLYKAGVNQQGNVERKRMPVKEFITRYNDGPLAWCAKTGELFVTRNYDDQSGNYQPFQQILNRLRIYIARKENGRWVRINDFPWNNPQYSVGHPAINASGDTLIFSSDKPGGYGKTDLYYSVRKNGIWEDPVNMGPKINTPEKEEFAFITQKSDNGRYLIFSSTRGPEGTDLDLYYTEFPSGYDKIFKFGQPINSEYDDFSMTIPDGREFGYFTSNRPGTGSDDIYKFTFKKNIRTRELYVYDINSRHPIPGATVNMCKSTSYLTDVKGKIDSIPCSDTGCNLLASAFGYHDKQMDLPACKLNVLSRDTIWMKIIENKKIILRNIYYDFDRWNILPEASRELDRLVSLMNENPEMKVELSSHTDERGSARYNLRLSELRASSAIDYIVSKGIDRVRIQGKGYGKTQLIHQRTGGKKITPQQNRENRRTEILIPGFLRGEPVKQHTGDYSDGKPDHSMHYSSFKEHGSIFETSMEKAGSDKSNRACYLILGSFQDQESAIKFMSDLEAKNLKATIIGNAAPFRVGCVYATFNTAKMALESLRPDFGDGWILCN